MIQSSCQTLLILDAWSRRCAGDKDRSGRQLITFLLVGNFALWLLNRVKNARAEFHPLQVILFIASCVYVQLRKRRSKVKPLAFLGKWTIQDHTRKKKFNSN